MDTVKGEIYAVNVIEIGEEESNECWVVSRV